MNNQTRLSCRSDRLGDVLHEIETIRLRRQQEVKDRPSAFLKRFTQQELTVLNET